MSSVKLSHVTKVYGGTDKNAGVRALDDVTIEFPEGKLTTVMGPSGSGKSTLLYAAAGLTSIDQGTVTYGDTDVFALSDAQRSALRRRSVGFIFQAYNLFGDLTAADNITLPLRLDKQRVDKDWVRQITERLGIADRLGHKPSQLSGGQQQRVAIARSLLARPMVIFADEPTGALDSASSTEVLGVLQECVHEFGQTIVMVTHDPGVTEYADVHVRMLDGRVESMTPRGAL